MEGTAPVLLGAGGRVGRRVTAAWRLAGRDCIAVPRDAWTAACPAARGRAVIVLAGVTAGDAVADNVALAWRGVAAARAWEAAHTFILSSSAIYGPTGDAPAAETRAPAPVTAYGAAKAQMEAAVCGPGVTALRLANVAGASQPFLSIACGGALTLDRFADGTGPSRSFIGPCLLAEILGALADRAADGGSLPEVLNVAAPDPVPMAAVFRARNAAFDWRDAPPGAVDRLHMDVARLARLTALRRQDAPALWAEADATA